MQKSEIVTKTVRATKLPEADVLKVVNATLTEITLALKRGKRVELRGFGNFVIRRKKKRTIHSVNSRKIITLPAHKAVVFEVGDPLRKMVW